ncbi:hypothetical protein JMJ35_006279 [Cladonia borealis]|uniref:Dihydrofolate reductase n=1 Tax=Cladonia borealis TaxID=184061 RepID=A0AA39U9T6_9LECA|nr:hypothetical protein JMJ35_006279 [Cladonia borealis]
MAPSTPSTTTTPMAPLPPLPPLTLIVATTPHLGIGLRSSLPWPPLKPDLALFARVTKRPPPIPTSSPSTTTTTTTSNFPHLVPENEKRPNNGPQNMGFYTTETSSAEGEG